MTPTTQKLLVGTALLCGFGLLSYLGVKVYLSPDLLVAFGNIYLCH